jgi:hypothetical protein
MSENIKKILPLLVVAASKSILKTMPLQSQLTMGGSYPLPF